MDVQQNIAAPLGAPSTVDCDDAGKTRLLVLQPTPFCNINCDYCYLQHRSHTARMSPDVVVAALMRIREAGMLGSVLSVIWHAGEPLVAPISFYRESFRRAADILSPATTPVHHIQTNGTLIDDDWCRLFLEWGVRVGVSIDGPALIHDRHRKTRDGRPTHQRVMAGILALQRAGVPFHVIAVVTADSLDRAEEIIQFFWENGITEINFNIDESEGANEQCSLRGREHDYRKFIAAVARAARRAPMEMVIRELKSASEIIRHGIPHKRVDACQVPYNPQNDLFSIISVDHRGGFSTFSPELLDQIHPVHGSFVLGNVLTHSLLDAARSAKAEAIRSEILSGVAACRDSCEFFPFCGGGAPANKLAENGSMDSTETLYCRCVVQVPFLVALQALEQETSARGPILNARERA